VSAAPILEAEHLSRSFGGIRAVDDVTFKLCPGEIVGLIGPNGAGKTTLVNLVTGVLRPTAGRVRFEGRDVTGQQPHQAARRGIARTFQIVQPFPEMTVIENVAAAAFFGGKAASIAAANEQARAQLALVGLGDVTELAASALTLPQRKRLELAKSLAMKPRVLLLDEVNAGLNSAEIEAALHLIRQISSRGISILIIEHLMKVVFSVCDRILVLHHGALISEGKPDFVASDERVIRAYLGSKFAERRGKVALPR
jgi:branched-chain amino acid transport system ATP-binding protein